VAFALRVRSEAFALIWLFGTAMVGRAQAQVVPPLSAVEIFDRTRMTVGARTIPPYIVYTQYAAFIRRGKVRAERSRVVLRMADGKANVTALPNSPSDRVDPRPVVKDRPLVYPTTTFGLVKRRSGEQPSAYESRSTPQPDLGQPPVIGRVASVSREYDPTLLGVERIDGGAVYHLALVPRFDPEHHPIRAMWVATTTFEPVRMAIEVWAKAGPVRSRPTVTIDFAPVAGVYVIAHAAMDFVLRFAFLTYAGSGEFRTADVSFPATEPDWMFDAAALRTHLAGAPPAGPGR